MVLNGETYKLNQCTDIWEWFGTSHKGEYTHYYTYLVFNTDKGFYCTERDLTNGRYV